MSFILEAILKEKKMKGYSWNKLAESLPISGDSLRIAFNRKSVDRVYLEKICDILNIKSEQFDLLNDDVEPNSLMQKEIPSIVEFIYLNEDELMKNKMFFTWVKQKEEKVKNELLHKVINIVKTKGLLADEIKKSLTKLD